MYQICIDILSAAAQNIVDHILRVTVAGAMLIPWA